MAATGEAAAVPTASETSPRRLREEVPETAANASTISSEKATTRNETTSTGEMATTNDKVTASDMDTPKETPATSEKSNAINKASGSEKITASKTTTNDTEPCHLLDLPPELRNRIYDLAFPPPPTTVNCLDISPPSKALTLTCKQINAETSLMYRSVYRAYWKTTTFVFDMCGKASRLLSHTEKQTAVYAKVAELCSKDVKHMRHVKVVEHTGSHWTLSEHGTGEWQRRVDDDTGYTTSHLLFLPKEKVDALPSAAPRTSWRRTSTSKNIVAVTWGRFIPCPPDDIPRLHSLVGWNGLSKEELTAMVKRAFDGCW